MISSILLTQKCQSHLPPISFPDSSTPKLQATLRTGLCFGLSALLWLWLCTVAQAQTAALAQQTVELRPILFPQDEKAMQTSASPPRAAIATVVPYDEAMQKLRERPMPKIVNVEEALTKVKPKNKSMLDPPFAGSREKTVQALQKRLSSSTKKKRPAPTLPPGHEEAKARIEKPARAARVDANALFPKRGPPRKFVPAKAKNGLTGSFVPYGKLRETLKERRPVPATGRSGSEKAAEKEKSSIK